VSPTTYTPPPPQTDGPANAELSQYPEDLNPPELPRPTTEAERTAYLETNALYDQTLQEIDCPVEMIDWTTASAEAVDDLLTVIEGCIMRVWSPALEAAGWVLPRPGVTVYTTDITTACGTAMRRNAFYCSVDQQIYYSYDYPDIVDPNGRTLLINAVDLMAHEFGHHIQGRTGILRAERYRENTAETQEEANEYSRRTEVQADCFSGIFNRAIAASVGYTEADWASIRATLDIQGDNGPGGDHGQSATRIAWMERGASGLNVSQCNSYIAPSSEVT
jgi:predicted metalloprotease